MASVDEFGAAVDAVAAKLDDVTAALGTAKDAGNDLAAELQAANIDGRAAQTRAVVDQVDGETRHAAEFKSRIANIRAAVEALRGLLATLTAVPSTDSGTPTTATTDVHHDLPESVRRAAEIIPLWDTGDKATGVVFATGVPGGRQVRITSGDDESLLEGLKLPVRRPASILGHVESHTASGMRKSTSRTAVDVTLVINKAPCPGRLGCDRLLPGVLPKDSQLRVYVKDSDGIHLFKVYQGTGERIVS